MTLLAESPHTKYGSTVFVRMDLKVNSISVCNQGTVEFITVVMPGVVVLTLYKPPTEPFVLPALGHINLPHIVTCDFISYNTTWGYTITDNDGNLILIHNAKLPKSFNSARWQNIPSRPHLCIAKHCRHV